MESKFKINDSVYLRGDSEVIYTVIKVKPKNRRLNTWSYDILGTDDRQGTDIDEIELKSANSKLETPKK